MSADLWALPSVAWISGGAGGLGEAFSRELISENAGGIILVDVDRKKGDHVLEKLRAKAERAGRRVPIWFHCVDVCDSEAVKTSLRTANEAFGGRLNLVVNNHGIAAAKSTEEMFDVNALSVISATRQAYELLSENPDGGSIVNVASASGIFPIFNAQDYTAAKHAVVGFSRCFEQAKHVTVNAICPAFTETSFLDVHRHDAKSKRIMSAIGIMHPQEVAQAMLSLAQSRRSGQALYLSKKTGLFYPFRDQAAQWLKHAMSHSEAAHQSTLRARL